jgi:hypothetical protein
VGFEPTIPAGQRLQTYTLDRVATGTGTVHTYNNKIKIIVELKTYHAGVSLLPPAALHPGTADLSKLYR